MIGTQSLCWLMRTVGLLGQSSDGLCGLCATPLWEESYQTCHQNDKKGDAGDRGEKGLDGEDRDRGVLGFSFSSPHVSLIAGFHILSIS